MTQQYYIFPIRVSTKNNNIYIKPTRHMDAKNTAIGSVHTVASVINSQHDQVPTL